MTTGRPAERRLPFELRGLAPRVTYDTVGLALDRQPPAHSHAEVAPHLARLLERASLGLVAGLVNNAGRLFAVARIETRGPSACQVVSAAAVYRAVIACGARAVYLAHRHADGVLEPSADDLLSAARVYATGLALGLELRDSLLFGAGGRYSSLLERGEGVEPWRQARLRGDPDYPRVYMRLHQAGDNRRPERPSSNRSDGTRAALWECPACERRQLYKHACRYCGTPRPA